MGVGGGKGGNDITLSGRSHEVDVVRGGGWRSQLVNFPAAGTLARLTALGAGVRVHVVPGDDVDAHFARRPSNPLSARPPRERHGSLAAAVVEQVDVGAAEVPVAGAVDDVVDTRLAECQPRKVVEQVGRDLPARGHAEDDSEGQPEDEEHDETE